MSNPFWEFSLAHYELDDVPQACLVLQDEFGLDVNLLLYAAWLASLDLALTADHLAQVEAAVAAWREEVVLPTRELRRNLKEIPGADALREKIARLELEAEAHQQDLIFACYRESVLQGPGNLAANLAEVAGLGVDRALLATLERALAGVANPIGR